MSEHRCMQSRPNGRQFGQKQCQTTDDGQRHVAPAYCLASKYQAETERNEKYPPRSVVHLRKDGSLGITDSEAVVEDKCTQSGHRHREDGDAQGEADATLHSRWQQAFEIEGYQLLVVRSWRIVDGIMEAARIVALLGLAHNQVTHVDDIAQFADFARGFGALEEFLGFLIENVETVPSAVQTEVRAHDAHVCAHNLIDFSNTLCDKHHFFGVARAFIVPFRHIVADGYVVDTVDSVFSRCIGIYHCFNQRVGSQAVATMYSGARALA